MPFNVCGLAVSSLSSPYEQELGKSVVFLYHRANSKFEPFLLCQLRLIRALSVPVGNCRSSASPVLPSYYISLSTVHSQDKLRALHHSIQSWPDMSIIPKTNNEGRHCFISSAPSLCFLQPLTIVSSQCSGDFCSTDYMRHHNSADSCLKFLQGGADNCCVW